MGPHRRIIIRSRARRKSDIGGAVSFLSTEFSSSFTCRSLASARGLICRCTALQWTSTMDASASTPVIDHSLMRDTGLVSTRTRRLGRGIDCHEFFLRRPSMKNDSYRHSRSDQAEAKCSPRRANCRLLICTREIVLFPFAVGVTTGGRLLIRRLSQVND